MQTDGISSDGDCTGRYQYNVFSGIFNIDQNTNQFFDFNKFNLPVLSCMREEEPIFTTIRFFSFIRSLMLLIFMFSKFHLLYILHTFVILHHLRQNVTFFLVYGNLLGNF